METIKLQIFQYHRLLSVEEVVSISFNAQSRGMMTLLPEHMPVIASIKDSIMVLKFTSDDKKIKQFWIQNGILSFQSNQASLVADQVQEKT